MISPSKASKRLGIVGAAAVVGLVPITFAAAPAFASTVTSATLSLSNSGVGATGVTATNGFTATSSVAAGGTITINSLAANGGPQGTTTTEQLPTTIANYSVTVNGTPDAVTGTPTANQAVLTVANAIPASAKVVVTITGVANPTSPSTVDFGDLTSGDTTQQLTNAVSIGNSTVTTPAVSDVNPRAIPASAPFTITGTNFAGAAGATATSLLVCFVPTGTTAPTGASLGTPAANETCPAPSLTATTNYVSATEIQGNAPAAIAGANANYDVVVYNYNPTGGPAAAPGYTGPSAQTTADQVTGVANLDFVPETGVRVVDSRSGMNTTTGAIPSGSTVAIPLASFANSPTQPTNLPGTYTALDLNVTAIAPSGVGNLQIASSTTGSCAAATFTTATVNFQPPQDTSNYTIIGGLTPATGALCIKDNGASVNVAIDLTGYETGAGFTSASARLLDTRPASETGGLQGPLTGGTVYSLSGLTANATYALNVAAVAPSAVGNLRVFPEPQAGPVAANAVPNTAVVNYIPGTDSSSFYIVKAGPSGKIDIYSDTSGTVNVVIDEYGTVTSGHVTAINTPYRLIDTRPGGIAAGGNVTVKAAPTGSGTNFIPTGAVGVIGSLSDINPTSVGYENVYPDGALVPSTANIPHYPSQIRENLAIASLSPTTGSFHIFNSTGTTDSTYDATAFIN